MVVIDTTV